MISSARLFLIPCLFVLVSCGESNREVIESYRDRYDKLKAELASIAEEVPGLPENEDAVLPVEPTPEYFEGGSGSNTAILMYEQLKDPKVDLALLDKLDLMLGNGLDIHLAWTGEPSSMSEDVLDDTATGMEKELNSSLRLRYIGVVRVLRYVEPEVLDADSFIGGKANLGVHLWDREGKKKICSFNLEAESDDKVKFVYREGKSREDALKNFAKSTLHSNARKLVLKTLADKTGGTFEER